MSEMRNVNKFFFQKTVTRENTSMTQINPLKTELNLPYIKTRYVPRSKHFQPRLQKTNDLLMFTAKVAVCSEICTGYINAI
jgi:hypothetical protein